MLRCLWYPIRPDQSPDCLKLVQVKYHQTKKCAPDLPEAHSLTVAELLGVLRNHRQFEFLAVFLGGHLVGLLGKFAFEFHRH